MSRLGDAIPLSSDKILNPAQWARVRTAFTPDATVLVVLAAGKGTRFGTDPKCIQPVSGTPLARHSIEAFRRVSLAPVICLVSYRHQDVSAALGPDNLYVLSANPAGGTGQAAYEAFSVADLAERNPLLIVTYGDRIVPPATFRRLREVHRGGKGEADLTFLTAVYEPPRNRGKGRILRGDGSRVLGIVEEKDIAAEQDETRRLQLQNLTEGNCPLYAIRAATLHRHLVELTNANAQGQYYLTDVIERICREGGDVRTVTTTTADAEYDLLCSDVTQPMDLALLEGILASSRGLLFSEDREVDVTARAIAAGRPKEQIAAICRQLSEVLAVAARKRVGFQAERPVGVGVSGGRLRIAFMHPDMARFFGPAWQMPIGAGAPSGDEQIVLVAQAGDDRHIHLLPTNTKYREIVNSIPSDWDAMYPGEEVSGLHAYEGFGTRMSESLLLKLGYFSDEEVEARRLRGLPLPPASLWVSNSMRRPFALVGNAIASLRTLRSGTLGAKVQECLGREKFQGLRIVSTGQIPEGGFSSSSAVTVATKNAINALFDLGIPPDLMVHLACQAEYGTGVRAGSLDQATEQKGASGQGTLISSNPRENYRIIATYPVPTGRFQILFPYSVERDRNAWRWSAGVYAETTAAGGALTASETRKMTGKAAEVAALLTRLPLDRDFFKPLEEDLVSDGLLEPASGRWIASVLRELPLLASQQELRRRAEENRDWYAAQLAEQSHLHPAAAAAKADAAIASLFGGWRDPVMRRAPAGGGAVVRETGVPLRAMMAYLFAEVAKNFYLIHHPDEWIACVTASQWGDCSLQIDPDRLPPREQMTVELPWERGVTGPDRLELWLERAGALPFDYNQGLDDAALDAAEPPDFRRLRGSNFFRGLALIDLAGAMLQRAFGRDAVAVRVNAAGQGDFFQVHVDTAHTRPEEVKRFLVAAFYRRFGLSPSPEFVEIHPGGGAAGVRLSRYDEIPHLVHRLEELAAGR